MYDREVCGQSREYEPTVVTDRRSDCHGRRRLPDSAGRQEWTLFHNVSVKISQSDREILK